jgi:site-specific DNA-methyltransferase (adenine-specific)
MSGYMAPSKTVEWGTPQDLFDSLNKEFNFTVDVAADSSNAKCSVYYTKETDGLSQDWSGQTVWCNPPYGKEIALWVKKAHETVAASPGTTVVLLIPVRSDVRWFHDYVLGKAEIRFIRGRLKFGGSKTAAPFPNMLVVYKSS